MKEIFMAKKGALTGLLLFGIFFGAGNLIFPPSLGALSGEHFLPAIAGFVFSGVGIAVLTLIIGTLNPKGYIFEISTKIAPWFATLYLSVLYLSIGPFFAIPRTATTAYEVGISPLLSDANKGLGLIVFTVLYFAAAYLISLNPSKILDRIGRILTPVFAILIVILVVLGAFKYGGTSPQAASAAYQASAFGTGFLEGYVLTGRHGFFASYESFLRVVDSMITQHFKWLRKAKTHAPWRKNYPSLNLIATSTVFQQDHNGYTHQDPGLLTHLAEKKPEFVREYLPADTNSLMAVMAEALSSEDKINLIVSSKHPRPQFYSVEEAKELVREGYKVIDWASTVKEGEEPDVVIAAAGTEPNLEALAGISILHKQFPELKIRFINVVDILKLRSPKVDPRGLSDEEFDKLFTTDKPVVFCFHGYEGMIRDLFFDRNNHNVHIHGYRENGDITTPFDMRVLSEMDRFHVAKDAAVAVYGDKASEFAAKMDETVEFHHSYIREHGEDIPEVVSWQWENVNK